MDKETILNDAATLNQEDDGQLTDDEMQPEVSKQWEALALAHDVFVKQLARGNAKLSKQIKQLNSELSLYRAGWVTLENEKATHVAQIAELQETVWQYENDKSLVTCLIDGNTAVFNEEYVAKGNAGGRQAAAQLSKGIAQHLDGDQLDEGIENRELPRHHQITATIFVDVSALADKLSFNGICSTRDFEQFVLGFNQASPLLTMVDVGSDQEAADAKTKGTLLYYSRLNQTRSVIFCGAQERGSIPHLKDLQAEGLLDKLTVLNGSVGLAPGAEKFCQKNGVRIIDFPGLFMQRKLLLDLQDGMVLPVFPDAEPPCAPETPLPWMAAPGSPSASVSGFNMALPFKAKSQAATSVAPSIAALSSGRRTPEKPQPVSRSQRKKHRAVNGGTSGQFVVNLPADQKEPDGNHGQLQNAVNLSVLQSSTDGLLKIDFKKGLLYQNPPLCYTHYISACPRGANCIFSHNYTLNRGQLKTLRTQVKTLVPCVVQNNTQYNKPPCPNSPKDCPMSHYCPKGPSCPRKAAGNCSFKGRGMHDPQFVEASGPAPGQPH